MVKNPVSRDIPFLNLIEAFIYIYIYFNKIENYSRGFLYSDPIWYPQNKDDF